jgi:hypothetical protein
MRLSSSLSKDILVHPCRHPSEAPHIATQMRSKTTSSVSFGPVRISKLVDRFLATLAKSCARISAPNCIRFMSFGAVEVHRSQGTKLLKQRSKIAQAEEGWPALAGNIRKGVVRFRQETKALSKQTGSGLQ